MRLKLCLLLAGWCLVFGCGPHWLQWRFLGWVLVVSLTACLAVGWYLWSGRRGWILLLFPLAVLLADCRLEGFEVGLGDAFAVPRQRSLTGWVCSEPVLRDERLQFDFCLLDPDPWLSTGDEPPHRPLEPRRMGPLAPEHVGLTCHRCRTAFAGGDFYRLTTRISTVRPLQNPDEYFAWQRAWRRGLWQGTVKHATALEPRFVPAREMFLWRQTVLQGARQAAASLQHRPTLLAMVLGDASLLHDGDWQQLRQSGLMHLVVVSGLHVSAIVALTVMVVGAVLRRTGNRRARLLSYVAGAAMVVLFLGLTGLAVPVLRASLMSLVVIAALLLKLRTAWFDIYLLALCGTLWVEPFAFVTPGFWLSFAAVLVLLLSAANRGKRRGRPWIEAIRLQGLLSVALLPLTGFFYGEASLAAFFLNLLAVPLVTLLILPVALFKFALVLLVPPFADLPDRVLDALLGVFWWLAQVGNGFAGLAMQYVNLIQLTLVTVLALALITLRRPLLQVWLLAGLATITVPPRQDALETDEIRVVLLDVGQGLSIAIQQSGHWLLYDTGPAWPDGWNSGEQVILPFLRRAGLTGIDTLIVSHGDNDHAGGAAVVAANMTIPEVLHGEPQRQPELAARACQGGQRLLLGQAVLTVLWPLPDETGNLERNNLSCTLLLDYGGRRMLFPGDLEIRAQRRLVEIYGDALRADVLLVPHHGARSSFLPDLISRVDPELAVVSAGYRNRFGHPHPVVTKWLAARDIPFAVTARDGAIELRWRPGGPLRGSYHGFRRD